LLSFFDIAVVVVGVLVIVGVVGNVCVEGAIRGAPKTQFCIDLGHEIKEYVPKQAVFTFSLATAVFAFGTNNIDSQGTR
jgi:hypothetical protein